ncbi:predicted protein [Botrytis cinerea T4]|uniref:Uncharacterized protein n=1 Tax=Botryotinia fuckeliana (strain T4) TaxID=999810 RepID=G2YPR0_BOTF4|nr:predicted protein [Botrytis cinerea T4]
MCRERYEFRVAEENHNEREGSESKVGEKNYCMISRLDVRGVNWPTDGKHGVVSKSIGL